MLSRLDHFGLWHEQPVVIVDCETTGVEPARGDKIVELAAVRVHGMKVVDRWRTYLNPDRDIPLEASLVHGIHDEDVTLSRRFHEVADDFFRFCADAIPCSYQESFDRGFVLAETWNANMAIQIPLLSWPRWLDPLTWVRSIDRFVTDEDDKKVSNDLASACARRGVVIPNAHSALDDAEATAALLATLVGDMPRCTVSELIRRQPFLSAAHDRRRKDSEWRMLR